LNYTKDLTYNAYSYEANGKQFMTPDGSVAIGSYWCPPQYYWENGSSKETFASGSEADCRTYGALYTWETAMMVDGKYADDTKASSAWDESWVSPYYYDTGAPATTPNADRNNARGENSMKGGGRGICPMGWHVPTEREWATMLDSVVHSNVFSSQPTDGTVLTNAGLLILTSATFSLNQSDPCHGEVHCDAFCGVDSYGFNLIPAGWRASDGSGLSYRGERVAVMSSSVASHQFHWYYDVYSNVEFMRRRNMPRYNGKTVRCLLDR
jgi:uncharacterized protein (TIGR02145 family)